jgi:hypothetical protein
MADGGVEVNIYSLSMYVNFTVRTNSFYELVSILIPVIVRFIPIVIERISIDTFIK